MIIRWQTNLAAKVQGHRYASTPFQMFHSSASDSVAVEGTNVAALRTKRLLQSGLAGRLHSVIPLLILGA